MIRIFNPIYMLIAMLICFCIGCSSGHNQTMPSVQPSSSGNTPIQSVAASNHELSGIWTVSFDLEKLTANVEIDRESQAHFNVRPYLPFPTIRVNSYDATNQIVNADVIIRNTSTVDGYDVRLIIYTDSVGHKLTNPDNWTGLFDIPGGLPVNPFKAYAKATPQRIFTGGSQYPENLLIKLPGGNSNVNFAIDASFPFNCQEPYSLYGFQQEPLYDKLNASADVSVNVSNWNTPATVTVDLECAAIAGAGTISLSSSDNKYFEGTIVNTQAAPIGTYSALLKTGNSISPLYLYDFVALNVTERPDTGWVVQFENPGIIGVEVDESENIYSVLDTLTFMKYDIMGTQIWSRDIKTLDSYSSLHDLYFDKYYDFVYLAGESNFCGTTGNVSGLQAGRYNLNNTGKVTSGECPPYYSLSWAITADKNGSCYHVGAYYPMMDSNGDSVMRKLSSSWGQTWYKAFTNPDGSMIFRDLAYNEAMDTVYGTGEFWGTSVDFDPGSGVQNKVAQGDKDSFLYECDSAGAYKTVKTWGDRYGSNATVTCPSIVVDSNRNVFVAGSFTSNIDFDPGTGIHNVSSGGYQDIYISKFDSNLNFIKVIRVGSTGDDTCKKMAIGPDDSLYITGGFEVTVDFDPSSSVSSLTSKGFTDIFLAKYTNDLALSWVRSWGDYQPDLGVDVAVTVNSNVILVGKFFGTIDCDPGEDIFEITSDNSDDTFIMRLLPSGDWK